MENDTCRGEFTPDENHVGYDQMTHGGILYSLLDDVMANWLFLQGARGHTARCEIRYREPLPIGTAVELAARVIKRKGRLLVLDGTAVRSDTRQTVATCQGSFIVSDTGSLTQ